MSIFLHVVLIHSLFKTFYEDYGMKISTLGDEGDENIDVKRRGKMKIRAF